MQIIRVRPSVPARGTSDTPSNPCASSDAAGWLGSGSPHIAIIMRSLGRVLREPHAMSEFLRETAGRQPKIRTSLGVGRNANKTADLDRIQIFSLFVYCYFISFLTVFCPPTTRSFLLFNFSCSFLLLTLFFSLRLLY